MAITPEEITLQLEGMVSDPEFAARAAELTDTWSSAGAGPDTIAPVLRFIEEHPSVEFGTPGPLVHFVERFFRQGYEEQLGDSIRRRPTVHTVWMLNRVINGTREPEAKQKLIGIMQSARLSPLADESAREMAARFLARLEY